MVYRKTDSKSKRKQKAPHKKWRDDEVAKIIDYLWENRNLEQPTAQIYYRQFLEESQIDASWDLVRWKVRYLKICYFKAEEWRKKSGPGIELDLENGVDLVNDKLRKLCVHYDRLKDIFGKKSDSDQYDFDVDINSVIDPLEYGSQLDDSMSSETYSFDKDVTSIVRALEPSTQLTDETSASSLNEETAISSPKASSTSRQHMQKFQQMDSTSQLSKFQNERNELLRMRLMFEKEKFQRELDFNREKFNAEIKIRQEELEMKRMEIEKSERLKMLEIEKDERIAKYELALKYRNMNQN